MPVNLPLRPPLLAPKPPQPRKDPGRSNDEHGAVRADELAADAVEKRA